MFSRRNSIPILLIVLILQVLACGKRAGGEKPAVAEVIQQEAKPYQRVKLIDAHTHLSPYMIPLIKKVMEENGIEYMINFSGGNMYEGMGLNVKMAKIMEGKILNMFNPDWTAIDEPDFALIEALRLEDAVKRHGYAGMKISKALGLYVRDKMGVLVEVDDPALDPLWEKAGELNVPVTIHTADPKAFFLPADEKNERYKELSIHPHWSFADRKKFPTFEHLLDALERVIDGHPLTTFVAVHFGNDAEDPDYVARMLDRYPNLYIDTAARVPEFGRHDPEKIREFFLKYQDRILFGTDLGLSPYGIMLGSSGAEDPDISDIKPFYDAHFIFFETSDKSIAHPTPIQGDWKVNAINLPPDVLEKLYRKNAEKLFFR
ncbi:MAG: amidohydrolase family protein [Deltaproteobacteria bacterium]|nr:amidohydrolase family protein [Deltaproteobacteria bacterium]